MANIRVTPETLEEQGNGVISISEEIRELLSNLDSKINEIIDGWDGLAQDSYFSMYGEMKTSLDQFPEIVKGLGDATVAAAQAFAQVDEQLSSSFNG